MLTDCTCAPYPVLRNTVTCASVHNSWCTVRLRPAKVLLCVCACVCLPRVSIIFPSYDKIVTTSYSHSGDLRFQPQPHSRLSSHTSLPHFMLSNTWRIFPYTLISRVYNAFFLLVILSPPSPPSSSFPQLSMRVGQCLTASVV